MLRHRKNVKKDITLHDLQQMDESLVKFDKLFHRLIAPVMPSRSLTMKYHKLSHVTSSIIRLGHTREFDAQFYEASNKQQKASYNTTSKKTSGGKYLQEMATHQTTAHAMTSTTTFDADSEVIHRNSAYLTAARTGRNAMAEKSVVSLPISEIPAAGELTDKAKKFINALGDYNHISNAVRASFAGQPIPGQVHVRHTAVVIASVSWLAEENELQTIRAAPDFHGRPYYDTVIYKRDGNRPARRYGMVRLVFKVRHQSSNSLKEMVCIQVYEKTSGVTDVLVKAGCIPLTLTSLYEVVPLDCILQRIYVVRDYQRGGSNYHTCKWKWSRTPIQD
jgi:hypothetical protein